MTPVGFRQLQDPFLLAKLDPRGGGALELEGVEKGRGDAYVGARYYVVTQDMRLLVKQMCLDREWRTPSDEWFDQLDGEFFEVLERAVADTDPDLKIKYLGHAGSAGDAQSAFGHLIAPATARGRRERGEFWVSLDPLYSPNADFFLSVNRVQDENFPDVEGPGVRAGAPIGSGDIGISKANTHEMSYEAQLEGCLDAYRDALEAATVDQLSVIIADDGTFTGGTVFRTIEALEERAGKRAQFDFAISEIRWAFCTIDTLAREYPAYLRRRGGTRDPLAIRLNLVLAKEILLDWVCERDFYIGVPRSGRTVGRVQSPGMPGKPWLAENGRTTAGRPYLEPWGDIGEWASIGPRARSRIQPRDDCIVNAVVGRN